jgi:hypothetical protein
VRRAALALGAAAGLAVAVQLAAAGAAAQSPLAISVRTPLFAGSDLVVEVRASGVLAGRPLAVQLAVDGASVGRFETSGDVSELRASPPALSAGWHEILVKTGSVRATARVRVWPGWLPAAMAAASLAAAGLGLVLWRRRAAHR